MELEKLQRSLINSRKKYISHVSDLGVLIKHEVIKNYKTVYLVVQCDDYTGFLFKNVGYFTTREKAERAINTLKNKFVMVSLKPHYTIEEVVPELGDELLMYIDEQPQFSNVVVVV